MRAHKPGRKRRCHWIGRVAMVLLLLIVLLAVALYAALFTTTGAQWLAARAMNLVPQLSLNIRSGRLWDGLDISDIQWRTGILHVEIDSLVGNWELRDVYRRRINLNSLKVEGVRVAVSHEQRTPREREPRTVRRLDLPLKGHFEDVQIIDVMVDTGKFQCSWDKLEFSGGFGDQSLHFGKVKLVGLNVIVPPKDVIGEKQALIDRLDPSGRQAIELPEIMLPIDLYLDDLSVETVKVDIRGRAQEIDHLKLSAQMVERKLTLHHAEVAHPRLSASLQGHLIFENEYPLDLKLTAGISDFLNEEPLHVHLELSESIADLQASMDTTGVFTVSVAGKIAPLDPRRPMDVELSWRELGWPPRELSTLKSRQGSVRVNGALDSYRIEAEFDLGGARIPESNWNMAMRGDLRQIELVSIQGELLGGSVRAKGRVGWIENLNWSVEVAIQGMRPEEMMPQAPTDVHAQVDIGGAISDEGLLLDIKLKEMQAVWNDMPLHAVAGVKHRTASGWKVESASLSWENGSLHLDAAIHDEVMASVRLEVADIAVLHREGRGSITGVLDVRGKMESPYVNFKFEGDGLGWARMLSVDTVTIEGEIAALGLSESGVALHVNGISLPAQEIMLGDLRVEFDGTRQDHRLALAVGEGPVLLDVILAGGLDEDMGWDGQITAAVIEAEGFHLIMAGNPALIWDPEEKQVYLAAHEWKHNAARLIFPERLRLGTSGQAEMRLEDFNLEELSRWMPDEMQVAGFLETGLQVSWKSGQLPHANIAAEIKEGSVTIVDDESFEDEILRMSFDELVLDAGLDTERGWIKLNFASDQLGRMTIDASVDVGTDGAFDALQGNLVMESLDIGIIRPFLPMVSILEGGLDAEINLAGDIRDAQINGRMTLYDAAVEIVGLPVNLSGIRLLVTLEGERAVLEGDFRSGEGTATLSGEADWSGDVWQAAITTQGSNLELSYADFATMKASHDIRVRIRPGEVRVAGSVTVPEAHISIRQLPDTAVRPSGDVVFVDEIPANDEEIEKDVAGPWAVAMEVDLILGDKVSISGYGLTARLEGGLDIRQAIGEALQIVGDIRIVEGQYRAYRQRLTVREGRFLFAGPVDQPDIFVEAVRSVPAYGVVAGLRVEGSPEQPRMTLFSEPALPEEEILSFLILGRPLSGAEDEGISMLASAALALGVAGGSRVAGVAEDFGLEDVEVDLAGTGEDTEVVVSGRIGSRLTLSYGLGVFTPVSRVMMRYQLTGRLFLEAVSSQESALDLFYTFSF